METPVEINMNLFICACAISIVISAIFVTELSIKTGITKPFEESSTFENRKDMLAKRYLLIAMSLLFWGLSYLSLWYYYSKEFSELDTLQENLNIFLVSSFIFLLYFYFCASHWRKKPSELEENIEHIGKKD
jgi:hypothetical protein